MRLPQVKPVAGQTRSPKGSFMAMAGTHSSGQEQAFANVGFEEGRPARHHLRVVKTNKHVDGTACLEGAALPSSRFRSCCEFFESHTRARYYDLRFDWRSKARG